MRLPSKGWLIDIIIRGLDFLPDDLHYVIAIVGKADIDAAKILQARGTQKGRQQNTILVHIV